MNLEAKSIFNMETTRIKSITGSDKLINVVITLMSGEVLLIDKNNFKIVRKIKLCEGGVRTSVIIEKKEWIIVGTDEGEIILLDAWTLDIIRRIKGHDDFVRKIVVDEINGRMISVSDDNSCKLWEYENGIKLIQKYKLGHYGMDVSLCPGDRSLFVVALLNGKISLYSVEGGKSIKTFRGHEKGVNCVCFISSDFFVSGSDDTNIFIWDYKRGVKVGEIIQHTGMVNNISKIGNSGFCSCSGDGSIMLWNEDFTCAGIRNTKGRVWSSLALGNKLFIGSDEELSIYIEKKEKNCICGGDDRIIFNTGNIIKSIRNESFNKNCKIFDNKKNTETILNNNLNLNEESNFNSTIIESSINSIIEDIGLIKEIGTIDSEFLELKCTKNGKFLIAIFNNYFNIFSTLGLRKKLIINGNYPFFVNNEILIFLKDNELKIFNKLEEKVSFEINLESKILYADNKYIIIINEKKTFILSTISLIIGKFEKLHSFDIIFKMACYLNNYFILFKNNSIQFYTKEYKFIDDFQYKVNSFVVDTDNDILYFTTIDSSFYCFIVENKPYFYELPFLPNLVVSMKNRLYFFDLKPKAFILDITFYNLQRSILSTPDKILDIPQSFTDRVIAFYESLGLHEKALALCQNKAQKFEIFLNLNMYDEAFLIADSVAKLTKLARLYLKIGDLEKASECFYNASDFNSLFLIDVFSGKKYLDKIAVHAKSVGQNNLAFAAFYKTKNYFKCAELLKGTPFCNVFKKHYLPDN